METQYDSTHATKHEAEEEEERLEARKQRYLELFSAIVMAAATILTAWSAYESSRWSGQSSAHQLNVIAALVNQSKFASLAEQRRSLDVSLYAEWVKAINANDTRLAEFTFTRFPEPLKTAAAAWRATDPLNNLQAPTSPFVMPEYALPESAEEQRWAEVAAAESEAADRAGTTSDRYLLFTVVFATTLFFAGISGKFGSFAINAGVLLLGALLLIVGAAIMFTLPIM
ncbi:MAG: hypothetical protein RMN52_02845 [Anaerolineae bacterium]|nr:hypothetical protein [Candidatus Roseilinea sp.]MDW8448916.1 hypothetical protein [Anaerolineae bacterium]